MRGLKKDLGSEVTANVLVNLDSGDEGEEKEGTVKSFSDRLLLRSTNSLRVPLTRPEKFLV